MTKKTGLFCTVCNILALLLSLFAVVTLLRHADLTAPAAPDVQYVLYLGTNDKDTNEPVFPPEEAMAQAEAILLEHFGGFTIQEAHGGWVDSGTVYREYTIVITLSDTTLQDVHSAADDMIRVFNQSSVLIQENQTTTSFYSGAA